MLVPDYLSLRMTRLRVSEEWRHQQDGLSFVFPRAGRGAGVFVSGTRRLGPGDVLVFNPAGEGKLQVPDGAELVFWSFSTLIEHLFPLFGGSEISRLQHITDRFKAAAYYPASSPMAAECHRLLGEVPPQFDLDHRGQLLRVVAAILSVEFKNLQPGSGAYVSAEEHLRQVFEKLSVNEILILSVAELAEKFGCSRRHLNRLFHQHFGLSVAALRMEMRLLKAISLLRDPNAKIINIAEQCGFNHLGLFNTCFKRRFGTSPGQWRKTLDPVEDGAKSVDPNDSGCRLRDTGLCPWAGRVVHGDDSVNGQFPCAPMIGVGRNGNNGHSTNGSTLNTHA